MRCTLLLFLLISIHINTLGQELKFGDELVEDQVKKTTSWIYENKDETRFFLTKKRLQKVKSSGTNLVVHLLKGEINRVITTTTTKKGLKSTEWYFSNEQLIFVYDVFEFFSESRPETDWKNFKGLFSKESRYYFVNRQLAFHKHKGRKDVNEDLSGDSLMKDAKSILNYIERKLNHN